MKVRSALAFGKEAGVNSDAQANPTAMTVRLDGSLDTVIVAAMKDSQGNLKSLYLEDFDFRDTQEGNENARKLGLKPLAHIHVAGTAVAATPASSDVLSAAVGGTKISNPNGATADRTNNAVLGVYQDARPDGKSRTKTERVGEGAGFVATYQESRVNYIPKGAKGIGGAEVLGDVESPVAINGSQALVKQNNFRTLDNTVAEVYGTRVFVEGQSVIKQGTEQNDNGKNAPFIGRNNDANSVHKGLYVESGKLNHVQYGRVTSKIHDLEWQDFRKGVEDGSGELRVASFGLFGQDGTENHYFYRSNDTERGAVSANLETNYANNGKVVYNGHAVTYGLNHDIRKDARAGNSVGYEKRLVSGTHVRATIDLGTNAVNGSLYDNWQYGSNGDLKVRANELVAFSGKLNTENGSIVGEAFARNNATDQKGQLHANLFGTNSDELGGQVNSLAREEGKAWGAVFGAQAQPKAIQVNREALSFSTDEVDSAPRQ